MAIYIKKSCPKCEGKQKFLLKQVEQALPAAIPKPEDSRNAVYVGFTACENCGEVFSAVFGADERFSIEDLAKPEASPTNLPPESVGLTLIPKV